MRISLAEAIILAGIGLLLAGFLTSNGWVFIIGYFAFMFGMLSWR